MNPFLLYEEPLSLDELGNLIEVLRYGIHSNLKDCVPTVVGLV